MGARCLGVCENSPDPSIKLIMIWYDIIPGDIYMSEVPGLFFVLEGIVDWEKNLTNQWYHSYINVYISGAHVQYNVIEYNYSAIKSTFMISIMIFFFNFI